VEPPPAQPYALFGFLDARGARHGVFRPFKEGAACRPAPERERDGIWGHLHAVETTKGKPMGSLEWISTIGSAVKMKENSLFCYNF
jgi:hypothetical protein